MTPAASTRRQALVALAAPAFAQPDRPVSYVLPSNALLEEDRALRRQIERMAAQRRALPSGELVPRTTCSKGSAPTATRFR